MVNVCRGHGADRQTDGRTDAASLGATPTVCEWTRIIADQREQETRNSASRASLSPELTTSDTDGGGLIQSFRSQARLSASRPSSAGRKGLPDGRSACETPSRPQGPPREIQV